MGQDEIDRIKEIFSRLNLHPIYRVHESVVTSKEAARTRGDELKQGIKALLFTNGKGEWIIVNVPADLKVDMKKLCEKTGWSRSSTRMATPEEVLIKTGCEIGAVPPFGHREKIQLFVDEGVYNNEFSAFNIGLRTESVKILTSEVRIVFSDQGASEADLSKS